MYPPSSSDTSDDLMYTPPNTVVVHSNDRFNVFTPIYPEFPNSILE